MYGYNEYIPLSIEEILKRTSEEEIFKIIIQQDIILDKEFLYKAPYRDDIHPDCYFERYDNKLWFVDFANSGKATLDCFQFIKKVYQVDLFQALRIISEKLHLGLGDNLGKTKKIIHEHGYVEEKNVKKVFKERVITILPRQYNHKDKLFWSKYEITKQQLLEDGVIPLELYQSISKKGEPFSIRPFDICYAYSKFYDLEGNILKGKVKIYRPLASKDAKWFTNCNQNIVGSIEYLAPEGENLIITKSYKDCRVLRNFGLHSVWFQNEGMIPNKQVMKNLISRFKNILVWYDNDGPGITSSRIVVEYINSMSDQTIARGIIIPPKLIQYGIKDPSDYLEKQGNETLLGFLAQNKII